MGGNPPLHSELGENGGERLDPNRGKHAEELALGSSRIDERTENIEDGPLPGLGQFQPHGHDRFESGVEGRGKKEAEIQFLDTAPENSGIRLHRDPEAAEKICGATLRGNSAVTVLEHRLPTGGSDDRRGAGNIISPSSASTGSHNIDRAIGDLPQTGIQSQISKNRSEGRNHFDGLSAPVKSNEKFTLFGRSGRSIGKSTGRFPRFGGRKKLALLQTSGRWNEHGHGREATFASWSEQEKSVLPHSSNYPTKRFMYRARLFLLSLCLFATALCGADETIPTSPLVESPVSGAAELGYMDALVLGLVEGITEYLPISSTGHLILTNQLLGLDNDAPLIAAEGTPILDREGAPYTIKRASDAYAIIIQAGAILAVAVLYWSRLWGVAMGFLGQNTRGLRLGINLIVAFIPAAVLGLLLDDLIESLLFSPLPIAIALAGGAVLMWGVERWRRQGNREATDELDLPDLTYGQCLTIGFLQCVAMWPGTSRSMMTIVGGYVAGLSPRRSAEFSFLLGFITLSAAAGYKTLKDGRDMMQVLELGPLLFGTLMAFVSAALAVKWLVGYLSKHGLGIFAGYRLGLALLVLIFMS